MSRVILAEINQRFNVGPARHHGELVYLNKIGPSGGRTFNPLNPKDTVERMNTALTDIDFDPEKDFICMTGQALTTAMLLSVASTMFGVIRLLIFDSRTGNYTERLYANNASALEELKYAP